MKRKDMKILNFTVYLDLGLIEEKKNTWKNQQKFFFEHKKDVETLWRDIAGFDTDNDESGGFCREEKTNKN